MSNVGKSKKWPLGFHPSLPGDLDLLTQHQANRIGILDASCSQEPAGDPKAKSRWLTARIYLLKLTPSKGGSAMRNTLRPQGHIAATRQRSSGAQTLTTKPKRKAEKALRKVVRDLEPVH